MRDRILNWALLAFLSLAQDPILIRAGTLIDGKGGFERNVTVEGGKISKVAQVGVTGARRVTYDFPKLTLLPGMIDTHVHLNYHFGPDGPAPTGATWWAKSRRRASRSTQRRTPTSREWRASRRCNA